MCFCILHWPYVNLLQQQIRCKLSCYRYHTAYSHELLSLRFCKMFVRSQNIPNQSYRSLMTFIFYAICHLFLSWSILLNQTTIRTSFRGYTGVVRTKITSFDKSQYRLQYQTTEISLVVLGDITCK
jgi:hypothetical protein